MSTDPAALLQQRFPQQIIGAHPYRGQATVYVKRDGWLGIAGTLRDDPALACDFLMDLTVVDYLKFGKALSSARTLATPAPLPYYMTPTPTAQIWERPVSNDEYRFDVVYHFYSSTRNHRVRIKVPLASADPVAASLTGLWQSANWFEREAWDLCGVRFTGHPNLRRILMYESFQGHPLRKDYPVRKRQPLVGPVN